jgi:catechol 2,3-dioxygenase-like lactoylglutathione lyase family enzyme
MTAAESAALNVTEAVPFFRVTDLAESLRFYRDGLGFRVAREWAPDGRLRWCQLQLGGASLMLRDFTDDARRDLRPEVPLGVGVSVCFLCRDALALHDEATRRGLFTREPFVGNGLWVTSLIDPDGYRVDFESPTDAPEDTTLSEWRAAVGAPGPG